MLPLHVEVGARRRADYLGQPRRVVVHAHLQAVTGARRVERRLRHKANAVEPRLQAQRRLPLPA